VGRAQELASAGLALGSDRAGLVITGAPGVGKSRLALEVLQEAANSGMATEWIMASRSGGSVTFGAFAHLIPPGGARATQLELMLRLRDTLARRGGSQQLVVGVDDVDLLDGGSTTLIHMLATRGIAKLVLTMRTSAVADEPIAALWKDGVIDRIELRPHTAAEITELLERVLDGHVDSSVAHAFWRRSQGNILYVRELVTGALDSGSLIRDHGVWILRGTAETPRRLAELVAERLAGLAESQLTVVEMLAVGAPIAANVLVQLSSEADVSAVEQRGLLAMRDEAGRLTARLAHPLFAEVLVQQLPALRARALRRRIAAAIEATGHRRRADVLAAATLRLDAGVTVEPALAAAAAREAASLSDHRLAQRLATAALATSSDPLAAFELAESLHWQGRYEQAEQVFASIDLQSADGRLRTDITSRRAWNLFAGLGQIDAARRLADEGATGLDEANRNRLVPLGITLAVYTGAAREAVAMSAGLIDGSDLELALEAIRAVIPALAVTGRSDEALRAIDRGFAILQARDATPAELSRFSGHRAFALGTAGRIDEARQTAQRNYDAAVAGNSTEGRGNWGFSLGRATLTQGLPRTAIRSFREAAEVLREINVMALHPWCMASLAQAHALVLELPEADAAFAEAEDRKGPASAMFDGDMRRSATWIAAARGEVSSAIALALESAEIVGRRGQILYQADNLHDVVRLGAPHVVSTQLAELAREDRADRMPTYAAHAAALIANDGPALAAVASRFEAMGTLLFAAEAAAEAAASVRHEGHPATWLAYADRARALRARCEGAQTPALLLLTDEVLLTRREREVAHMAGRGLSNREIASRLGLSLRTVENHLHNCYAKLEVSRRAELGAVLATAP